MHQNQPQSSVIDFVNNEAFIQHFKSPSPASERYWNEWLADNPDQAAAWREAQNLLEAVVLGLDDYARTYLSEEKQQLLLERIRNTISSLEGTTAVPIWRKPWVWQTSVAASILLVLVLWRTSHAPFSGPIQDSAFAIKQMETHYNTKTERATIALPDGSKVWLSSNSRLSYLPAFQKGERKVYLSGEAEFEVVKDLQKPFYVYSNEVVTKVLGTRFVINAFDQDQNIIVSVKTGQVNVFRPQKDPQKGNTTTQVDGVLLSPNQQVVFTRENKQFKKTLVQNPSLLNLPGYAQLSFRFDETPVKEVFERLETAYGIDIVFNEDSLKECQITADLAQENLFQKLNIITSIIDGKYEVIDGQIVIATTGCE
jgi:transmembrane sensor